MLTKINITLHWIPSHLPEDKAPKAKPHSLADKLVGKATQRGQALASDKKTGLYKELDETTGVFSAFEHEFFQAYVVVAGVPLPTMPKAIMSHYKSSSAVASVASPLLLPHLETTRVALRGFGTPPTSLNKDLRPKIDGGNTPTVAPAMSFSSNTITC